VEVDCGADQTFTITPDPCYQIADVVVDGKSVGPVSSYTFEDVTSDHTIVASFELITYTLTVASDPPEGGTVTGGGTYSCGAQATVIAIPNPCYKFVNWTEGGVEVSTDPSYSFTVEGDRSLVAHFAPEFYTITVEVKGQGTVELSPFKDAYCKGDIVQLTAIPDAGWRFERWEGDLSGLLSSKALVIDGDKFVVAVFKPSEIWVDDDWEGTRPGVEIEPGKVFGVNAFATIQKGIEAAFHPGIVHVNPGTYVENIKIATKSIQLLGPNAGVSCSEGNRGPEAIIVGSIHLMGGGINNGTVIDGFTIVAPEGVFGGANVILDSVYDLGGSVIKDVLIQHNIIDTRPAVKRDGIAVWQVENLTINKNCFLSGSGHGGVDLASVEGVQITGNDFTGEDADYGISVGKQVSGAMVSGNSFRGYTGTGAVVAEQGASAGEVSVHKNNFLGNDPAVNNLGTGTLDATFNWWGNPAGPSHNGVVNGDPVLGEVLFDPWLKQEAF